MPFAIGVDAGTTNTKAVLCELPSCRPIHIERMPSPRIAAGDRTDYDIHALVQGILDLLSTCVEAAKEQVGEIAFISVASVGESGVLVHADSSYSEKSIFWYDNRGESYAQEAIASGYSSTLSRITGIPTHSNSALFKILWMRDHGANLKDATWLTMADFVAWFLSGELGQGRTLASRTSVYDIEQDCMSEEILSHYGLPKDLFAPLVESGSARDKILDAICQATGLPKGCQVCVSGHDHMSGAIACSLKAGSEALNSTGTSEGLLLLNEHPSLAESSMKRQITNGRYVEALLFTSYAFVPSLGLSFEWSLKSLGYVPDEYYRDVLVFATHAGTTMEFARLCDCITDGRGLKSNVSLKVIGPAARNPLWMQLKADLIDVPFIARDVTEAVARGAVVVAARKLGIDAELEFSTRRYEPDPERHALLEELFHREYIPFSNLIAEFESRSNA